MFLNELYYTIEKYGKKCTMYTSFLFLKSKVFLVTSVLFYLKYCTL